VLQRWIVKGDKASLPQYYITASVLLCNTNDAAGNVIETHEHKGDFKEHGRR